MFWKLLLATSFLVACQPKPDMPRAAKRLSVGRVNPMVIIGNSAAYTRILEKVGAGPR
jgi:hypothetical protein